MSSDIKCAKLKVMKKFFYFTLLAFYTFILSAVGIHAQTVCSDLPAVYQTPCNDCYNLGTGRVWTAIGCLNAGTPSGTSGSLIGQLLVWATILGSGFAFLIIVFGGFQIATAAGDPKKMKAAQELIWSGISGLLLIIFSIFLLNLIGFNILSLGGPGGLGLPFANP